MIPLRSPQEARRPTAIALGSFDGLHQGHRRVIAAVTGAAGGATPTVVSFWPHPREVLYGEPRLRLDLPAEKLHLLEPLGIEQLVLVPFTRELAALSPEAFVEQVLVGQLGAQRVAVGDNFRFGAGRSGDSHTLAAIGQRHGIDVQVLPMLWDGQERVSSSRIRRALAAGDVAEARRLLERPYRFSGRVVRGRGLGQELGWPTANLQVDGRKFLPLEGVYAAAATVAGGPLLPAVMNLGPQPTVDPMAPSAVEVHLLDRRLELDGLELVVEPLQLLRRQQTFASFEALSAQIARDADEARALTAGIGVGQAPADEGGDPAEQQNP
ncbi:bifunctional riboflavin kinase/FAD synthetase [Cyanobium sp. Alchichica 3B3-8F6]|uniref:bifunctional riboflavin kinase/FAD synthetase n=1 Tax=Cyanobium sp. Alchichica 3B3-8F6 TaxID=2823696 RepID=UPI0020CF8488|nr:bifunctional riboflavin kinase/FAD synthetase [Cyanobium sp. Alchichica 3B3-8F6]MCP9881321.1 bifunctional riboflavin kinase/FAD synthetase [Cyanobium sp. Alchichica 3B3-8F6]